jgi:hypothetical protein
MLHYNFLFLFLLNPEKFNSKVNYVYLLRNIENIVIQILIFYFIVMKNFLLTHFRLSLKAKNNLLVHNLPG